MQAAVCGCPTLRRPPCLAAAPAMGYSPVCVLLRAVITSCVVLAVCSGRNDLRLTMHGRRVRALLVSRGMRFDVQCTDVGPACSLCVRFEQYGGVTPRCPRFVFRS